MNKDVIVIGGGIIGCAIAYSLQKRGKSVVLLERSNLVAGANIAGFLKVAESMLAYGVC